MLKDPSGNVLPWVQHTSANRAIQFFLFMQSSGAFPPVTSESGALQGVLRGESARSVWERYVQAGFTVGRFEIIDQDKKDVDEATAE